MDSRYGLSRPAKRPGCMIGTLFSIDLVPKPRMLSVRAVYVLSSLQVVAAIRMNWVCSPAGERHPQSDRRHPPVPHSDLVGPGTASLSRYRIRRAIVFRRV